MRRERVPESVPPSLTKPRLPANTPDRMLAFALPPHPPRRPRRHQRSPQVSLVFQSSQHLVTQCHFSALAALRHRHHATRDGASDPQQPRHQIDVLPAQRQQLALPEPGLHGHDHHARPIGIRCLGRSRPFLERQEVEVGTRDLEPLDLGNRLDGVRAGVPDEWKSSRPSPHQRASPGSWNTWGSPASPRPSTLRGHRLRLTFR
jgi:hypothetical protein